MSPLYRLTIPRPLCCVTAGFALSQVMNAILLYDWPWWAVWLIDGTAIWSIVSWRWTWVVDQRSRAEALRHILRS